MSDLFEEYSNRELLTTNIQFLGLVQGAWEFSRGARTQRVYTCPDNGLLHIRDFYTYVMDPGNREVISATRTLEWYKMDGTIGLTKDISSVLNIKNRKKLNRDIRQGRVDYMVASAEELYEVAQTLPDPYKSQFTEASHSLDILLNYYETEIDQYIKFGGILFEDAVKNEENPVMLNILNLMVRPPDSTFVNGLTIKQTIIHQLTGVY